MDFEHWDMNYLDCFNQNTPEQTGSTLKAARHQLPPSPVSPFLHESLKKLSIGDNQCSPLNKCNIMRIIGVGSFGRVHLVQHKETCKYYALKVLNKFTLMQHNQLEQIAHEVEILSSIQHPFIVRMQNSFQDSENVYIMLEYVSGGELFRLFKLYGTFPLHAARFYAAEVLLALSHLHQLGIIYRDLKPENILLDKFGHVKLIDFGFSKKVYERTSTICGTPAYIAPEIFTGEGYTKSVDYYALGILIYEMLVGLPPFPMDNNPNVIAKIKSGIEEFPPSLDSLSVQFIKQLCHPNPQNRLGNGDSGIAEIFEHEWFNEVNFESILNKTQIPPHVPFCSHSGDTRNFEFYPEMDELHPTVIANYNQFICKQSVNSCGNLFQ